VCLLNTKNKLSYKFYLFKIFTLKKYLLIYLFETVGIKKYIFIHEYFMIILQILFYKYIYLNKM